MKILEEILLSPKFDGSEFDKNCVIELFTNLDSNLAQMLLFNLKKDPQNKCFNGIFRLKEIHFYLNFSLDSFIIKEACKAHINGFVGTRLEEEEVLKKFLYQKYTKNLPQWVKE